MRKYFIIFWIFLFLNGFLTASTLSETVQLALQNNNQLLSAGKQTEKSREELKAAYRRLYPLLTLDSSYKYINKVATIEFPALPGQAAKEIDLGTHDTYDNGLTLSWLAFNGFAKESLAKTGELNYKIAQLQQVKLTKAIAFQTASLYLNLSSLKLQKDIIAAGRQQVLLQQNKIKSWVDNGTALPLDLMTLELSLAQYDQQLIAVDSNLFSVQENLNNLTGSQIDVPTASVQAVDTEIPALLISQNEDIQLLDIQRDVFGAAKTMAAAKNYPDLSLNASTRRGKPGVNAIDDKWMDYYTYGASLQWNVWDWGARGADTAAWDQQLAGLEYQRQALADQVRLAYNNSVRDLATLQRQRDVLNNSVQVARDKMNILQTRAQNGTVAATDFRDAVEDLTQTELKLRQHTLSMVFKKIELDYLSGKPLQEWRLVL